LQSSIADTRVSLQEIAKNLDGLLKKDETFSLVGRDFLLPPTFFIVVVVQQREISERESRIRELKSNHCAVLDRVAQRRSPDYAFQRKT